MLVLLPDTQPPHTTNALDCIVIHVALPETYSLRAIKAPSVFGRVVLGTMIRVVFRKR